MSLSARDVVDAYPFTTQADVVQQSFDVFHALGSANVPLLVVTVADGTGHNVDAVGPLLKGLQDVSHVHLASAGQPNDLDAGRVGEALKPGRVTGH